MGTVIKKIRCGQYPAWEMSEFSLKSLVFDQMERDTITEVYLITNSRNIMRIFAQKDEKTNSLTGRFIIADARMGNKVRLDESEVQDGVIKVGETFHFNGCGYGGRVVKVTQIICVNTYYEYGTMPTCMVCDAMEEFSRIYWNC